MTAVKPGWKPVTFRVSISLGYSVTPSPTKMKALEDQS